MASGLWGEAEGGGDGRVEIIDRPAVLAACLRGATVLTPNRRLARALKQEFDRAQAAAGRTVWPSADVLPMEIWLARSLQEADSAGEGGGGGTPAVLLSALQDLVLWREVIANSALGALLLSDTAARTAQQAWQAVQAYGLAGRLRELVATQDQRTFRDWAASYAQRLRAQGAQAPSQAAGVLRDAVQQGRWQAQRDLVLAGFDVLTPQQQALLQALREAGATIVSATTTAAPRAVRALACSDPAEQWRLAAAWARAGLTAQPGCRLAIVVPDLAAQRSAITHALAEALVPALSLAPDDDAARPFNLSLGEPLALAPLAATALSVLGALVRPLPLHEVGALLRSPYLGEAQAEAVRRARLDRALRDSGVAELDLNRLRRQAARLNDDGSWHGDAAPVLAGRLARALARMDGRTDVRTDSRADSRTDARADARTDGRRRAGPSVWAERFFAVLSDLGVPGDRSLNSAEFQTHVRLRELLTSLATLDRVLGPLALADAVGLVRRLAADTVFQPESPEVPVQVLGVLEAQHLQFDGVWVAQMTDEHWPPPATPNPLLPLAWQRAAGMPGAAVEQVQAQARLALQRWAASAGEVVLSAPKQDGDRRLLASPLLRGVPMEDASALGLAAAPSLAHALRTGSPQQPLRDDIGPALASQGQEVAVGGGTRLFADQAACAFRSFAIHRLRARELAEPDVGLDAADRGRLLHATLAQVWRTLRTHAALVSATENEREQCAQAAAAAAVARLLQQRPETLSQRAQALEQRRLVRTTIGWLAIELQRPPFEVIAIETPITITLGGLQLDVTPDRMDRLADGSVLIIDYKSRSFTTAAWLGQRPDEPQLPLYAVTCVQQAQDAQDAQGVREVGGIAFGVLAPGKLQFKALVAPAVVLPGATVVYDAQVQMQRPGWTGLLADWRDELERLAAAYLAGAAEVAPKRTSSCQYCPLPLLCRLDARRTEAQRLGVDEPGADAAAED